MPLGVRLLRGYNDLYFYGIQAVTMMRALTKLILLIAMVLMMAVSIWTTYASLTDSILPKPLVKFTVAGYALEISIFAMALSLAIGLMLFAIKLAIIDEQKRLNWLGFLGLFVIGFISISFNLDVLYRMADRDFYLRYSSEHMRANYDQYLTEVQRKLNDRRTTNLKVVARQEGELEAEVKGLRQAPEGYGPRAKQEDYQLTLRQKEAQVELDNIDQALAAKEKADQLLATRVPQSLDEIDQLQNDLRVTCKDMGALAGLPLPPPIRTESPLFAVFKRLFDIHTVGIKEVFFLLIAIFLDLGDIVGYSLVPNRKKKDQPVVMARPRRPSLLAAPGHSDARASLLAPPPTAAPPAESGNDVLPPDDSQPPDEEFPAEGEGYIPDDYQGLSPAERRPSAPPERPWRPTVTPTETQA